MGNLGPTWILPCPHYVKAAPSFPVTRSVAFVSMVSSGFVCWLVSGHKKSWGARCLGGS